MRAVVDRPSIPRTHGQERFAWSPLEIESDTLACGLAQAWPVCQRSKRASEPLALMSDVTARIGPSRAIKRQLKPGRMRS
jgi:hypothetical protein